MYALQVVTIFVALMVGAYELELRSQISAQKDWLCQAVETSKEGIILDSRLTPEERARKIGQANEFLAKLGCPRT